MNKRTALGNFTQALLFGGAAWWLEPRWLLPMVVACACAALQLGAAIAILRDRPQLARWASILTLIGVGVVAGLYWSAAQHLQEAYGGDARKIGLKSMGVGAAVLPWFVFWPLCQAFAGGKLRQLFLPLAALLLASLPMWSSPQPMATWPAQPELKAASMAAFDLWQGKEAEVPTGSGPAAVLLTPWIDGKAKRSVVGRGNSLTAAIQAAVPKLPAPSGERQALVVDLARSMWARGSVVRAAESGAMGKNDGTSPTALWHRSVKARTVLPLWRLPLPALGKGRAKKQRPTVFDSAVATPEGVSLLRGSWAEPPVLTAETALAAALAGGRMIAHNQTPDGKFAYRVQGPSGNLLKKGYNFPRHAGTTWFLARLAARTGDAEIAEAADAGLRFMEKHTTHTSVGGAYLHDPRRKDGKAWAGTTALAALAADVRGHTLAGPWGRFLARSIDEHGQVHGEMRMATEVFPHQKKNPYGQGQVVLALAALVRSGHEDLRPALARGAAYLDGDYAPGAVGRMLTLDEHWTCLAALAAKEALGTAHGQAVCEGYLHAQAPQAPSQTQRIRPHSGAAGGLAEAVIAGALLNPSGPFREQALAHGRAFLANAYKAADAPFLGKPENLIGGFRDTPGRLNVQMDVVQHVGCALLGIEALLDAPKPGSLP